MHVLYCRPMKNTISGSESRTFMKIIVDPESDLVLGIHMMGPDCAEIIQVYKPLPLWPQSHDRP